jgi:hypothetical protein
MVSVLIIASQSSLKEYIRLYRIVMIYALLCHYSVDEQNKVKRLLGIDMTEDQYQAAWLHLKKLYPEFKNELYLGEPIRYWCLGMSDGLELHRALGIQYTQFPLITRVCVSSCLKSDESLDLRTRQEYKIKNNKKDVDDTLECFNYNEFESKVYTRPKLTARSTQTVDAAYTLWLLNAYAYYHADTMDVAKSLQTTDQQWDTLSRLLGMLKPYLKAGRYPVLFNENYEPGQSLFWLKKIDYPSSVSDYFP